MNPPKLKQELTADQLNGTTHQLSGKILNMLYCIL